MRGIGALNTIHIKRSCKYPELAIQGLLRIANSVLRNWTRKFFSHYTKAFNMSPNIYEHISRTNRHVCQLRKHLLTHCQPSRYRMKPPILSSLTLLITATSHEHHIKSTFDNSAGFFKRLFHYNDVIMNPMTSQITSLTIVYSTVYSKRRSKKTSKLRVTGLCEGNTPVTGEFPAQRTSTAENASIWWCHHAG